MSVSNIQFVDENVSKESYLPAEEKIIHGEPKQNLWNNYSSQDNKFHVGIWDSEAGRWTVSYSEHEFCHILEGSSVIIDKDGSELKVSKGDQFVVPAGFEGEWQVDDYCKKIYVIYEA
jgi:uncharacterized cupin superfamily protein